MEIVKNWRIKKDYEEGVKLVEIFAPDHPLLPTLQEGETPTNKIYLLGIVPTLGQEPTPNGSDPDPLPPDQGIHHLERRLKELLQGRALTRNTYHDYGLRQDLPAVVARQRINRELIAIRQELHETARKIEYYKKTGEIPRAAPPQPPPEISKNKELQTLLNARSNVSKLKKRIRDLYAAEAPKEKIEKAEINLARWRTTVDLMEQNLKSNG